MHGNSSGTPIYLDYQATTPCDPRVLDRMLPYFAQTFGNPHSADHRHGWDAEHAVEHARRQIADLIRAKPRDIIFTSGATESNNLAIKGGFYARRRLDGRDRIITLASEHKCVLESVARLERDGARVTIVPIEPSGLVDPERLRTVLDDRVALVSVMAAHNEIGTIQPLREIAALARQVGAWMHTDAAQAFGKIPLDVDGDGIDLMSLSGHKIYGPKGIGALFIRGRRPKVNVEPLIDGGQQERGLRAGTLAPALCVGFGEAARIAGNEMATESARLADLRDRLWSQLQKMYPDLILNGTLAARLPGNLNITLPGREIAEVLASLEGLSVSGGSACSSGGGQSGSHVLRALGQDPGTVAAGIRIGLGRFTTDHDIEAAIRIFGKMFKAL